MSWSKLQLEYNNSVDDSVKATIQVLMMYVFLIVLRIKMNFWKILLPLMQDDEGDKI